MLDLGLSTSQLNIQSCFKQCGRANLLKGLTQPCSPQGNIQGRTANSSRAVLVTAQPCVGFTTCPCFATSKQPPLSWFIVTLLSLQEGNQVLWLQSRPKGWCLVCSPSLPASKGNLRLWRRRGKEEKQGIFWKGKAIAKQHAWQSRREREWSKDSNKPQRAQ